MKRYEKYKEVDLPWLKEVPEHWDILKNRNVFKYKKVLNKNNLEKNVLSLTLNGVINNDIDNPIGLSPKDYATYQLFQKNDLVFKLIDLNNIRTSRVGIVHEKGIMSSAYIRFINNKTRSFSKYYYYWFYKLYIEEVFNKLGNGVRETIGKDDLLNMLAPFPPLQEQIQIANFLDWKISEIDRLIEFEKEKINETKYIKNKIIDRFLVLEKTKSIKLKFIGNFTKGNGIARENLDKESEYPVILYGDIYTKYNFSFSEIVNKINLDVYNVSTKISKNTLLFTTSGETKEDIGKTVIYKGKDNVAIGGDILSFVVNNREIDATYLMYFLNSTKCLEYKYIHGRGDIIVHISEQKLKEIKINYPCLELQRDIVKKIDKCLLDIDNLISKINNQITCLEELKQTLIANVVTGKMDVRGVEIPEKYKKGE